MKGENKRLMGVLITQETIRYTFPSSFSLHLLLLFYKLELNVDNFTQISAGEESERLALKLMTE